MNIGPEMERIFHDVADLDDGSRLRYFEDHTVDPEVRLQVEALLDCDRTARNHLSNLVRRQVGATLSGLGEIGPGMQCGLYQLLRQIGTGGMGEVWLAERTDGLVKRSVAIKLPRSGIQAWEFAQRTHRERDILSGLAHPGIARLYDAGLADGGRPFLVLEFIAGVALDKYCDQRQLPIRARLSMFLQVLAAVQYAHSHLVIHSDLKPSNILVTGDGEVKLLDFGIAKLMKRGDTAQIDVTVTGARAMTPSYAAPEQIAGDRVTTACDIYSLGVILYELLSGQRPYSKTSIEESDPQLRELTRRPSQTVSDETRARARSSTPKRLAAALKGDLDNIALKAIQREPAMRYGTVDAFKADIERYLAGEPVLARPESAWYRTRKFVARHLLGVAVAVGVSVALAVGFGAALWEAHVAKREAQTSAAVRKVAEQRFAQVRQLANKFIELDNQIRGLPGSTKVRMQMVSDSLQYLTSLGSDVEGDKDLALEIAYAYVRVAHAQGDPTSPNLGQFAEARVSLDNAARFVDTVLARDPSDRRGLFIATTIAHDRMNLADSSGDRATELKYAASTASLIERFMSTHPVEYKDLYSMRYFYVNVAGAYYAARHFADAIRYCQRGLDIQLPGTNTNAMRGGTLAVLAAARWQSGDLNGALKTITEAIELQKAEAVGGHASLRINLANGYDLEGMILGREDAEPSLGRRREALADFQRALNIAEDLAQKDANDYLGRHNVATASLEVGNILRHRNPKAALAIYDHALARIREARSSAGTQRDQAELLAASSYALRWTARDNDARQRIAQAFALLSQAGRYPTETVEPMSDTYSVLRAQADDYAETGQTNKAIEAYQKLLRELMAWKPDLQDDLRDAICISRTWTALANLSRLAGRTEEVDRLESRRADLWNDWNTKLPNAELLLRQSLSQVVPRGDSPSVAHH